MMNVLLVFGLFLASTSARQGFGPGEQDWDFVNVRPGAYEFWWLYETTADVKNITEKPLVIWLQGGPGASSTGFGNFAEIGPLDENLNARNYTWVKDVNLLFIDNPVGTGYSYVNKTNAFTTNNTQIANDLITCLEGFYRKRPEFRPVPLYITSESYGGKMAAEFALELYKRIQKGTVKSNLRGVNMVDAWISPIDSVLTWAPFLLNTGVIDKQGYAKIDKAAQRTKALFDAGKYKESTNAWGETEGVISVVSKSVDFYNILKKIKTSCSRKGKMIAKPGQTSGCIDEQDVKIEALMNGEVKEALNITNTWGTQNGLVFDILSEDFMKPAIHIMERLLNETKLKVQVLSGQLDLIVDTPGTMLWVDKLKWSGSSSWPNVPRTAISVDNINEGYKKVLGNFYVYWINRSGHMVPADNPAAMGSILQDLIS
ncbi:hypothetical protein RN001_006168 [Aquatica leii]|uniref:Carboxypeptidase n=1 Tax=Aquatica leii TaxID=1421715 RepID=A0AAN7PDA9_9COLE|nr:hypothetical protein RN001_006168 [Aquatica leii]